MTGLRALAAFLVFIHHYQMMGAVPSVIGPVAHEGYLGVSIFFTLSGFLITRVYYDAFASGRASFRQYWVKRFARVYPPYAVLLVAKIALSGMTLSVSWLAYFTLTHAFFPNWIFIGLTPTWSLTVEECFYLSAPLVFLLVARYARSLAQVAGMLVLVTVAWWGLGFNLVALSTGTSFLSDPTIVRVYNIFGRFGEFAVGIFVALMVRWAERSGRTTLVRMGGVADLGPVAFVGGLLVAGAVLRTMAGSTYSYGLLAPNGVYPLWIVAVGTGALLWSIVAGSRVAQLALGNPLVEYLGRVSYVLYLLQDGFMFERFLGVLPVAHWLFAYAALNVVAAAVYHGVEHPVHAWITRRR